jgi:hypothetical protein
VQLTAAAMNIRPKVIIYICVFATIIGADQSYFEKVDYNNTRLDRQDIHQIHKCPCNKITLSTVLCTL